MRICGHTCLYTRTFLFLTIHSATHKPTQLALGTILFHVLARLPSHHANDSSEAQTQPEMGLYSWELWASMLWYAPLFVTSTMVLWLRALKLCSPALLSVGMNSNFVVRGWAVSVHL